MLISTHDLFVVFINETTPFIEGGRVATTLEQGETLRAEVIQLRAKELGISVERYEDHFVGCCSLVRLEQALSIIQSHIL